MTWDMQYIFHFLLIFFLFVKEIFFYYRLISFVGVFVSYLKCLPCWACMSEICFLLAWIYIFLLMLIFWVNVWALTSYHTCLCNFLNTVDAWLAWCRNVIFKLSLFYSMWKSEIPHSLYKICVEHTSNWIMELQKMIKAILITLGIFCFQLSSLDSWLEYELE